VDKLLCTYHEWCPLIDKGWPGAVACASDS